MKQKPQEFGASSGTWRTSKRGAILHGRTLSLWAHCGKRCGKGQELLVRAVQAGNGEAKEALTLLELILDTRLVRRTTIPENWDDPSNKIVLNSENLIGNGATSSGRAYLQLIYQNYDNPN